MSDSGQRIKKLRKKKKVSQQELSETLGYKTYTTVSKWESGTSLPPGKEIIRLADFFNVSTDYLLGLDDSPAEYTTDQASNSIELDYINSAEHDALYSYGSSEEKEAMPKVKVPNYIINRSPEKYFVARVQSDSMNRIINNGDNVVILDFNKVSDEPIHTGDILVVKIRGDYRIVHIRMTDAKVYLEPYSYLDGYETIVYSTEEFENLHKVGKIIYAFRQFV